MSTTNYSLNGSWNVWNLYDTRRVTAAENVNEVINTNSLVINASAISTVRGYGGGGVGYYYANGLSSSDLTFTGSSVSISSYAEALNAWSYGINNNSTLSITGDDNKELNIDAVSRVTGYDPAWGINSSTVSTEGGDDTISTILYTISTIFYTISTIFYTIYNNFYTK